MLTDGIEWQAADGRLPYAETVAAMERRAEAIRGGAAPELVWLVEHPPLYTAGTSADPAELVAPGRFPVHATGRGGRYTYHGPGQRIGYLMLDLAARGRDVRLFVHALERWLIATLARLDIAAFAVPGRVGIWTIGPDGREAKVGAIGVRVRRWVTLHGFAINIDPDLGHFGGIVPCGLAEFPVASLRSLGTLATMKQFDAALAVGFQDFLSELSGPAAA